MQTQPTCFDVPVTPLARLAGVALVCSAMALLSACGSGGSDTASTDGPNAARISAATATAENNAACNAIRPFFWEVGDASAALASGSVGSNRFTRSTSVSIASASKWLFGSYIVQKQAGVLNADDIQHLRFRSGYTSLGGLDCVGTSTVAECQSSGDNANFTAANADKFYYDGGHMQRLAVLRGLGSLTSAALATEVRSQLGTDIGLSYGQPQLAGGGISTGDDYARFLRKVLGGGLRMKSFLGANAACADPATCPTQAISSPAPSGEGWQYALGHWVEGANTLSDSAYSSPGAFGFYPWIDKTQTWYGVLVREDLGGAYDSIACGRLIRRAWVTATAQ